MPYFYDNNGWQTSTPNAERGTLIEPPAEVVGLKNNWTGVVWVQAPYVAPAVASVVATATVYTKMTKRSFFARFPKNADGISTKFSLITLFLIDDGYASSLGVLGATLYGLRALIITGKNAIDNSPFIDFAVNDAAGFTYLMMQASIPAPFRLTALERSAIMDVAITEAEAYK